MKIGVGVIIALISINTDIHAFELFNNLKSSERVSYASASSATPDEFSYQFPDIQLIDQDNQPIRTNQLFHKSNNVVFAFFFTNCVSVCTTVTLSLKSIYPDLPENTSVAMISIDPEMDTPDKLKTYAGKHRIKEDNWHLLTGNTSDIIKLQKSFEAYRGNKMNHSTSLYLKQTNSKTIKEIKNNFSVIPQLLKNS